MKTYVRVCQHLAQFFLEWEMFQTKVVDKAKTHILCSINVEIYGGAIQATDDNMALAIRVLDT